MSKVRFLTDSGSDITVQEEKEYGIDLINFQIALEDKSYWERVDFTNDEFYKMINESNEIPKTSQITSIRFEEKFLQYANEDVEDLIVVLINSTGSQTFGNAVLARDNFYEENPQLKDKMRIHLIDSRSYTVSYGYIMVEAVKRYRNGESVNQVVSFIEDWFDHSETYIIPFDLRHLKKSGRVSAAAAFLGELMGLKPIISLIDGESAVLKKARGDKAAVMAGLDVIAEKITKGGEYLILRTTAEENVELFIEEATKRFGYPPAYQAYAGGVIATNTGANILGVVIRGKKRER